MKVRSVVSNICSFTKSKPKYYTLREMLGLIDEPLRDKCILLYEENKHRMLCAKGSSHNHQSWEHGFHDHEEEIMNYAICIYNPLDSTGRKMEITLSDLLFGLFIHDLEKPWKYSKQQIDRDELAQFSDDKNFVEDLLTRYDISLTDEQKNCFQYIHGEGQDYHKDKRVQGPLAAIAHICDTMSARYSPEYPLRSNDPWRDG